MLLGRLQYFQVVAREGSFTRAAKILRVQQPAISKMVRQLEETLGLKLLERHRRGVVLTRVGQEIYEKSCSVFERLEEIQAISDQEKKECRGPLAFGVTDSVSSYIIPKLLGQFLRENPRVRPSLFSGSSNLIFNEISEGRIEFGISFTLPESGSLQSTELVMVPFQLVASPKLGAQELKRPGFIISREIDYPKSRPFPVLEMLQKQGVPVEVTVSSNNLDAQKQMALEGLGISLLPRFMLKEELEAKRLIPISPHKDFRYSLKLVTKKRKAISKNGSAFLERFQRSVHALI